MKVPLQDREKLKLDRLLQWDSENKLLAEEDASPDLFLESAPIGQSPAGGPCSFLPKAS